MVDGIAVLNKVKMLCAEGCAFVSWLEPKDVLLLISGCLVSCADEPEFIGPRIRVAGESLDLYPCAKGELAEKAAERLREICSSVRAVSES